MFAVVLWYELDEADDKRLSPTLMWKKNPGISTHNAFLPVQRIISKCSYIIQKDFIYVTPYKKKLYC
jgi:hypothetical protein